MWRAEDSRPGYCLQYKEDNKMELRITTQVEPGVLPEIEWNNEELKQEIAQKAAEYQCIA